MNGEAGLALDIMDGLRAATPELCLDVPRLLQRFEGLGYNCDFGIVQRAAGIEPFGLFRFASCSAADVSSMLQNRFAGLGEVDDLWLEENEPTRELRVRSRRWPSFAAHTKRYGGEDDEEVVRLAQIEATRFLKKRLLRDLSLERRVFVYKGECDIAEIRELAAQLRTYGKNCLLWVKLADRSHLPGSVERLSDGLLVAFVSYFGIYAADRKAPNLPVEEWIAICAKAYRLWRDRDPPTASLRNLISRAVVARSCQWAADPCAATRVLAERAPTGDAIVEHRVGKMGRMSVWSARLPVPYGGTFTFSAWVLIPEGFRGQRIVAKLSGGSVVAKWSAHVKAFGRWQRIWVAAKLPTDASSISCHLIAEGSVSDVLYSTSWCLERRAGPLGFGFTI